MKVNSTQPKFGSVCPRCGGGNTIEGEPNHFTCRICDVYYISGWDVNAAAIVNAPPGPPKRVKYSKKRGHNPPPSPTPTPLPTSNKLRSPSDVARRKRELQATKKRGANPVPQINYYGIAYRHSMSSLDYAREAHNACKQLVAMRQKQIANEALIARNAQLEKNRTLSLRERVASNPSERRYWRKKFFLP